jgi:hypothetical protein
MGAEGKVVPVCHEDVWGSGCVDTRILDLGIRWRSVVSFMLRPSYPWVTHWIGGCVGLDAVEWKEISLPCLE